MIPSTQPVILIVDDHEQNLKLIGNAIRHLNCRMLFSTSGQEALDTVNVQKPDLILLDIMMPNMDGFEVCEVLKSDSSTSDIPIIFVTAKVEASDLSRAFSCGAADYVTKPFVQEELISRIEVQLKLRASQKELQQTITLLSNKNDQLIKANQLKDEYLAMVAHDLKNPLAANVNLCDLLLKMKPDKVIKQGRVYLEMIRKSSDNMLNEIHSTLTKQRFHHQHATDLESFCVLDSLNDVINVNRINATRKRISINLDVKDLAINEHNDFEPLTVISKASNFREISDNLISNAVKYSPEGSEVNVYLARMAGEDQNGEENKWRLTVSDFGPGFSTKDKANMFKRFTKLSAVPTAGESSSGLGLYIAKTLAVNIGGDLSLDANYTQGARFIFEFADLSPIES